VNAQIPQRVPKFRIHKATLQAYVELSGKRFYLGYHESPEAKQRYHAMVAEWLANGRQLRPPAEQATVKEMIARYWLHAEQYYRNADGVISRELENIRDAMKPVRQLFADLPAVKFGPKASAGRADFLVGYHAAIDRRLSVQSMNTYYGYSSGWGWDDHRYGDGWGYHRAWGSAPMSRTYTRYYDEGSLILDFVTPQTRELIWRGAAKAEVDEAYSPSTKREQINEAVRCMLEQFPPPSCSKR